MPEPKIYAATSFAAAERPSIPLDGTLRNAQRFVDRITRSVWWAKNCKPTFRGEVPRKVVLQYDDADNMGGALMVDPDIEYHYKGKLVPLLYVGPHPAYNETPAVADPWLILHELAHVWEYNSWHDKNFIYAYAQLVKRYMGIDHHQALVEGIKREKIKLSYKILDP